VFIVSPQYLVRVRARARDRVRVGPKPKPNPNTIRAVGVLLLRVEAGEHHVHAVAAEHLGDIGEI